MTVTMKRLRDSLATTLVLPGDPGWDDARRAWNLLADQQPAAVAVPTNPWEVAEVVNRVRAHGLRVAPQTTGHNATAIASLDDAILLKTSGLTGVEVDADAHIARCRAGSIWLDVAEPASTHGLAALAGSSPDVGVAGFTLGGGIGWLSRQYGLAASSVTSLEIVSADGRQRRIDHNHDSDLFWAMRGGGGSFGVVTELEFLLYPVPELFAGWLTWPMEQAHEVLNAWLTWLPTVPEAMTSWGRLLRVPPLEIFPAELRGRELVAIEVAYLGDEESATNLLQPLRALRPEIDTCLPKPVIELSHLHMDPTEPTPGHGDHRLLSDLPPDALDAILETVGAGSGSSALSVELRHLGGALRRPQPSAGAFATLDASFMIFGAGIVDGPDAVARIDADVRALLDSVAEFDAGRRYANFVEQSSKHAAKDFFAADTYQRLRDIKAAVDPDELFVAAHPIPPA